MTETTPRREATRLRLVDAAIKEFAERGIDATSVEMLCERAGFTRGAFYSNFSSKDDVCVAIMEVYGDVVIKGIHAVFRPPAGAGIQWAVDEAIPAFFRMLGPTSDFRITMLEIRLRATRSAELSERLQRLEQHTTPALNQFLEHAAQQVGIRFRLPTDQVRELLTAVFFQPTERIDVDEGLLGSLFALLTEAENPADS